VTDASRGGRRPSHAEPEALVAEQAALIETLRAGIDEQDRVIEESRARLGQNSRNSSKPQFSDGYSKPPPRARSLRRRSGRKPGGQQGHVGRHLERREDANVTLLHVAECCECVGVICRGRRSWSRSRATCSIDQRCRGLRCVEHWSERPQLRERAT
jgi:hypothetical protein